MMFSTIVSLLMAVAPLGPINELAGTISAVSTSTGLFPETILESDVNACWMKNQEEDAMAMTLFPPHAQVPGINRQAFFQSWKSFWESDTAKDLCVTMELELENDPIDLALNVKHTSYGNMYKEMLAPVHAEYGNRTIITVGASLEVTRTAYIQWFFEQEDDNDDALGYIDWVILVCGSFLIAFYMTILAWIIIRLAFLFLKYGKPKPADSRVPMSNTGILTVFLGSFPADPTPDAAPTDANDDADADDQYDYNKNVDDAVCPYDWNGVLKLFWNTKGVEMDVDAVLQLILDHDFVAANKSLTRTYWKFQKNNHPDKVAQRFQPDPKGDAKAQLDAVKEVAKARVQRMNNVWERVLDTLADWEASAQEDAL